MISKYAYNYSLFDSKLNPNNEIFGELFKSRNTIPKELTQKKDEYIILFYSAEIKLSDCKNYLEKGILDGAFFVHGLFFAHEQEKDSFTTGTLNPIEKKISSQQKPTQWGR